MNEHRNSGLWDRAVRNLRGAWDKIARSDSELLPTSLSPELSDADRVKLVEQMQACLEGRGGEVSARARAAALGHAYLALNDQGRRRFLETMADEFGPERDAVDAAVEALRVSAGDDARQLAEKDLKAALVAPRVRLLTQFNALPEGVKFLVDMRAELLAYAHESAALTELEQDLKSLLASWFDVGFLELRQITWQAPAALLEKLAAYEAVHAITGWEDLKHRLAPDRRCFAFFHPRMPDEPLIFVWVALVDGIAGNIQELLDAKALLADAEAADSAVFYSISNAQTGLRGINFGDFLIKRVVDSLCRELPALKNFATLSPIPGFRKWLTETEEAKGSLLTAAETQSLEDALGDPGLSGLSQVLSDRGWRNNEMLVEAVKQPLMRLCAHYLLEERRPGGTTLDSVAHFHLSNGARMDRLNWLADTSRNGIEQSAGLMMNYRYRLGDIEKNHEAYRGGGEIRASSAVRGLLKVKD